MTHPHPNRRFVPQAVLTKSGKISTSSASINTAVRPVNTNGSKTTYFHKKVNTVRVKDTTARDKAVVSENKGKDVNDVKASACWGNPQQKKYKEKGVNDSVCSRHMTRNKCYLTEYEDCDGGFVSFGDGKGRISRKRIMFFLLTLLVLSSDFKLLDESQVLLRVPKKDKIYSVDLKIIVPTKGLTCLFTKATIDYSNLWNRRLGHINFKNINKLVRGNLVRSLPSKIFENDHSCVACQKGKQHKASCQAKKKTELEQEYILIPFCITIIYLSIDKDGEDDQSTRYTPVSIAGPSFTNDASSSPVNAARTSDEHLFEQFSPFKNAFTLLDVPNMFSIEDTGIFGNAYDDEDMGANADLNNLETTMTKALERYGYLETRKDDRGLLSLEIRQELVTQDDQCTPMEHKQALVKDLKKLIVLGFTPKTSHLYAVKRIIRYLKGQPKLGLWYPRDSSFNLEAFSDIDYAGASLDRKSITGGCQFLGKRLISWQCKKQTIVENSTTEAEYVAATNYCRQVLWIQNQMLDYGFNFMNTKIYIDNESTICIMKNPVFRSKTKHIQIRRHFIRDSYEKRLIQVFKDGFDGCIGLNMLFGLILRVKNANKLVSAVRLALCCWAKVSTIRHRVSAARQTRTKRGQNTKVPQSGGSPNKVGDEAINEDMLDSVERAATTASSLKAEHASGSGPWRQETIGGMQAQTRSEGVSNLFSDPPLSGGHTLGSGKESMEHQIKLIDNVPNTPHDSPIPEVNTPRCDDGSLELNELMDLVTKLSHRVFDLEKVKTTQAIWKIAIGPPGEEVWVRRMEWLFFREICRDTKERLVLMNIEVVKRSGDTEVLDTEKAVNTAGEGVSTASVTETTLISLKGEKIRRKELLFKDVGKTLLDYKINTTSTLSNIDPKTKVRYSTGEWNLWRRQEKVKVMQEWKEMAERWMLTMELAADMTQARIREV
ncbi:putative ribonuclease H-like domain-containing protein [Tanacetum coccineum]